MFGITNDTKDLKNLTVQQKNEILKQYDLTRGLAQKSSLQDQRDPQF